MHVCAVTVKSAAAPHCENLYMMNEQETYTKVSMMFVDNTWFARLKLY